MQSRIAIAYALALALSAGTYAASAQGAPDPMEGSATVASGVPLSWAPGWLVRSVSRAIADANDPRARSKAGAPVD